MLFRSMNPTDMFYNNIMPLYKSIEFAHDDVLITQLDKLSNRMNILYEYADVSSVERTIDNIYNALSSPNYYITRNIDIKGHEQDIDNFLNQFDILRASLKGHKVYIAELNKLKVKERINQGTIITLDGYEDIYTSNPGTRLPNRTSRFE